MTRFLADPSRPRVYGTLTSSNSIIVIDTTSLTAQTIPIGLAPVGLALSRDNSRLYVANSGSTSEAIGVVDLETLNVLPSLAAPYRPWDIAVGNGGICYLSPEGTGAGGWAPRAMRVDTATGASSIFGSSWVKGLLRINPVSETLYITDGASLRSYDVTTIPPTSTGQLAELVAVPRNFAVSHDGTMVAAPGGGSPAYETRVMRSSDLTSVLGRLFVGTPFAVAFSNDDKVAYQAAYGEVSTSAGAGIVIQVWDLPTFTRKTTVQSQITLRSRDVTDLVVDRDGKYLFVSVPVSGQYTTPNVHVYSLAPASQRSYPLNLSTRGRVNTGDDVLITGFIIRGGASKRIGLRGLGPSLRSRGIAGVVDDPTLDLLNSDGVRINFNDDCSGDPSIFDIFNAGLMPGSIYEAAFIRTVPGGNYTAIVRKKFNSSAGVALLELYDLDAQPASARFANVSTRGRVGLDDDVMIAGFIAGGNGSTPTRVVVRGIGPSMLDSGVAGALLDPFLEVRDGQGALVAQDDDWRGSQEQALVDSGLAPRDDRESAVILQIQPGSYTAIVRGKESATGVALVEVYNLDAD